MENFITDSKYIPETISIVISFYDILSPGDTIVGLPLVTVTVASGIDPSPSALLYLSPSVTGGYVVEQRFRLGLPGVIYKAVFSVTTHAGDILEKETYLAILPEAGTALPLWLPLWETTTLYPVNYQGEGTSGSMVFSGGSFLPAPYLLEEVSGTLLLSSGSLISIVISYVIPPEATQGTLTVTSGTLVVYVPPIISYNYSYEASQGSMALVSGTLVVVVINYAYSYEASQGTLTFTAGTLT